MNAMRIRLLATSALSCLAIGLPPSACAQSSKVPESLISAASAKPQRVIVMMAAPSEGGQKEAYRSPESFVGNLVGGGAERVSQIGDQPFVVTEVGAAELQKLQRSESVLRVIPDRLLKTSLAESTRVIDAQEVWEKQTSGDGVSVAVLDTGVESSHPFIKNRIIAEACFSSTSDAQKSKSLCADGSGEMVGAGAGEACNYKSVVPNCVHGTHVAGIVAGAAGNAKGVTFNGVAPKANIVAVKVFSRFEGEAVCGKGVKTCISAWTSDVLKGLLYVEKIAEEKKVVAINLSLGGGKHATACDDASPYADLVNRLRKANIAVIAASGNEALSSEITEPACVSGVIAVGAVKKDGAIDTKYSNSSSQVGIVAPGTQILSSAAGSYYKLDGTSMASPHVAGIFALLRARHPESGVEEILATIRKTGKAVTDSRNGVSSTLPDAEAAVVALDGGAGEPRPVDPKPDAPKPSEPKPADPKPQNPKPDAPDPRITNCGPVCIEEGKDARRIIFVLAKGKAVTADVIASLKNSFGAGAKVENIGDGKLLVELPVAARAGDIDRARKGVGDGTRAMPDRPLETLQPGQTIKIQ